MTANLPLRLGFIGLGTMGTPMALSLARKFPLTVWNRTPSKYHHFDQTSAEIASSPLQVIQKSDIIFTMLFDGAAVEAVINGDTLSALKGKILVNTSSVTETSSHAISDRVTAAGGDFVEMPVSGGPVPAAAGQLVGMMAGDEAVVSRVKPYVEPLTKAPVYCGPVGQGLKMKYAANLYLITMTAGLSESMVLARAQGLDPGAFATVLNAGPMASVYSRAKLAKMVEGDWSANAAIADCYNSTQLIVNAARESGTEAPLIGLCGELYDRAKTEGFGGEDMIAVGKVLKKVPWKKASWKDEVDGVPDSSEKV